jgi:hypothetical protein
MNYIMWLGIVALGVIGVKAITDNVKDPTLKTLIFVGYLCIVGFLAWVMKF